MSNQSLNHIAFIMDGNGRWASSRKLLRTQGHLEGAKRISEIIIECKNYGINEISFFAFSTENWSRPKSEISFLIKLLKKYLNKKNLKWFHENEIQIKFIGFKDKIQKTMLKDINSFCDETKKYKTIVNICFNYGSKLEIINACKTMINKNESINEKNLEKNLLIRKPVDLLIRTSGEKRISNFLLWQIAYAEIIFEETLWPDYNVNVLKNNIKEYYNRDRRYGGLKCKI